VLALCVVGATRADQTIQLLQQALKDQGYYYGNVTGDKSSETTAAVRRYQIRNGLQVTGDINQETLRSLNIGSNSVASPPIASTSPAPQANRTAPHDRSQPGFDSHWRSFSKPGWRGEMNRPLLGRPYEVAPGETHMRIVTEIQLQLASHGYYQGSIDGRYGPRTAFAVRTFQSRAGIPLTGQLDLMTLDALGVSARNMAYLDSTLWADGNLVPMKKFKHAKWKHEKWKAKWKKYYRDEGDEYDAEDHDWDHGRARHGNGHDDDD